MFAIVVPVLTALSKLALREGFGAILRVTVFASEAVYRNVPVPIFFGALS